MNQYIDFNQKNDANFSLSEEDLNILRAEILVNYNNFQKSIDTNDKNYIRELHIYSKIRNDHNALKKAKNEFEKLKKYFVTSERLDIEKIRPKLINVDDDPLYQRLFKLVRHSWSMPYSKGYGRRLRFLVWDEYHCSVIGIIGMQSPPADLKCRDSLFTYPENQKLNLVNQTMDVYTLGAIPPYSNLLGGKLVAGLVASNVIQETFHKKYFGKYSEMGNNLISHRLIAATTTSAFGKSSIYNRLVFQNRLIAKPIGYTLGFGTIHLEPTFPKMIELLKNKGIYHNGGYGQGPKPKWQNAVRALQSLGISQKYLKHGLGREVFLFEFCDDLESGMSGGDFGNPSALSVDEYSIYWLERWAKPRAIRFPEWRNFDVERYFNNALMSCKSSSLIL